ncbi:hypothetical protein BY996DRAFT_6422245 [Phakopsora pachyrhizi]|nr:hypothetical protein BY996DRAFT_6422245 [Phakopsora pachyrhizi]
MFVLLLFVFFFFIQKTSSGLPITSNSARTSPASSAITSTARARTSSERISQPPSPLLASENKLASDFASEQWPTITFSISARNSSAQPPSLLLSHLGLGPVSPQTARKIKFASKYVFAIFILIEPLFFAQPQLAQAAQALA